MSELPKSHQCNHLIVFLVHQMSEYDTFFIVQRSVQMAYDHDMVLS